MRNRDAGHPPVTVLGLGLMGQALAGAFLRDGYPTTVWNRTAAKAEHLVAQGARLAGSAGDAVADGHGGNGYAAMIEQFRKRSGVRP